MWGLHLLPGVICHVLYGTGSGNVWADVRMLVALTLSMFNVNGCRHRLGTQIGVGVWSSRGPFLLCLFSVGVQGGLLPGRWL